MFHMRLFCPILVAKYSRPQTSGSFERSGIAWKTGTIAG
jgi:hypothetical protein